MGDEDEDGDLCGSLSGVGGRFRTLTLLLVFIDSRGPDTVGYVTPLTHMYVYVYVCVRIVVYTCVCVYICVWVYLSRNRCVQQRERGGCQDTATTVDDVSVQSVKRIPKVRDRGGDLRKTKQLQWKIYV